MNPAPDPEGKALCGVRVLDLSRVLAGPYASMLLADLGADVVKIERPGPGDDSRAFGPFQNGESVYFASLNRNKRSLGLDLKSEAGRAVLLRLLEEADVLLENFRPGTMERLGLGYGVLAERFPRLVYAATSGFGHTGPWSQRPAYDLIVQALGGMMSLTGFADGPPTRVGVSIGDLAAGLFTAVGILAALHKREQTGRGQKVDVAMLDCQLAILENAIARFGVSGRPPERTGNRHPSIAPFSAFAASDGQLVLAVGNDALWGTWCECVGRPALARDGRFVTNELRNANWELLQPLVEAILAERPVDEWLLLFERAGVPAARIQDLAEVVAHPQVVARQMVVRQLHPTAGELLMPGIPVKLSRNPGAIDRPAPGLGEHGREVLEAAGFSGEEIARLRAAGVVV